MVLPKFVKKLFFFPILIIVLMVLNSLLEPIKSFVDPIRSGMNCPNSAGFDTVAWAALTKWQHLTYAPECYALNWLVIAFVGFLSILAFWGWLTK